MAFNGSENAVCQWKNPKRLIIVLSIADSTGFNLEIGDTLTLQSNKIYPLSCPRLDVACPLSQTGSVVVKRPDKALKPSVAISTPASIGQCGDIILDPSNSRGSAGRNWQYIKWTVTQTEGVVNSTALNHMNSYLNQGSLNTNTRKTIENVYITAPAKYSISLSIRNFLLETSTSSVTVEVLSVAKQPVVAINGPKSVAKTRENKIQLYAVGSVPSCDGTLVQIDNIEYKWKVYEGTIFRSDLISRSLDPRFFALPAYTLASDTMYTIAASATVGNASAQYFVDLSIGTSGIVGAIKGASKRSGSTSVEIDFKSASYDKDYPTDSTRLRYKWTCKEISPNFASACPVALTDASTTKATIPASAFDRSVDATYEISLFVEYANPSATTVGITASSSIQIAMVSAAIPEINFANPATKYNPDEKVIISTAVKTIGP